MRIRSFGHLRRVFAAWGLATGLAVVLTPVVAASTTLTYAISGVEYAATSTEAKFAGVGVATDDFGTWKAVIDHTPISLGSATITGGTFFYDGKVRDIAGTFNSGGALTQTGGFSGCSNETFAVTGSLTLTAPSGSGSFSAVLTHFRKLIFGRCITYFATVKGVVEFTLP